MPLFVKLFTKYRSIICLELFDSCVCQWVLCHLLDHAVWNGCNICSCQVHSLLHGSDVRTLAAMISDLDACNFEISVRSLLSDLFHVPKYHPDVPRKEIHMLPRLLPPEVPDLPVKINVTFVLIPSAERTFTRFQAFYCHRNLNDHVLDESSQSLCLLQSCLLHLLW